MSKVSVIVPIYNIEKHLTRCVESILDQSYPDIEVILINDGSNDRSGEIADFFREKDKRVKVFHQKNAGLSATRNKGIKEASGDFIALIDGDDSIDRCFIEKMMCEMDHETDIVVCGYRELENERVSKEIKRVAGRLSGREATIRLLTQQENFDIIACNKLYKRKLFLENKIIYPINKVHEDNLTTYKLYAAAKKISVIEGSLYNYYLRADGITGKNKISERLKMREEAAMEAIEHFRKKAEQKDLLKAAEFSLILAKIAWVDQGIRHGIISMEKIKIIMRELNNKREAISKNRYASKRVRVYLGLMRVANGIPYILFRKIGTKTRG